MLPFEGLIADAGGAEAAAERLGVPTRVLEALLEDPRPTPWVIGLLSEGGEGDAAAHPKGGERDDRPHPP